MRVFFRTALNLASNIAAWLATPSSANLAAAVTDETGTGPLVFGTGPSVTALKVGAGTVATAGDIRTNNTFSLQVSDLAVDWKLLEWSGTTLKVGDNATSSAPTTVQSKSAVTILINATSASAWSATLQTQGVPIVGTSTAFGLHGRATQAMADANQVLGTTIYSRAEVKLTGAITANRTATYPHPSSEDRSYTTFVDNQCTGGFSVVVSTGTGTTVTLANGAKQWFSMTPDGVKAKSAAA